MKPHKKGQGPSSRQPRNQDADTAVGPPSATAIDHFEAGGRVETFDLDVAQKALFPKIAEAKVALA